MHKHGYALFFFLMVLAAITVAQDSQSVSSPEQLPEPANVSTEETALLQKLGQHLQGVNISENRSIEEILESKVLLVTGSNMDAPEKGALEALKIAYPALRKVHSEADNKSALDALEAGQYAIVVLIGGPSQNRMTRESAARGWLGEGTDSYRGMMVQYGKADSGSRIIVLSDGRGYHNAGRDGLSYSPLSAFMPQAYVPIAATLLSAILLTIVSIGRTIVEFKALDIGRREQTIGKHGISILGINISEVLAIAAASLVLGASISWQYFGPTAEFAKWVTVNSAICLLAALAHELAHRLMAFIFGLRVEYRFWHAGSLLTLVSSWLGNAFSVQGFLLEEIPEQTAKWKVALMRIAGPMISTLMMLVFAIANVLSPSVYFQTIYMTSALWAFAEVFPLRGLDGRELKDWNVVIWFGTFLFVGISYVFVMFVL